MAKVKSIEETSRRKPLLENDPIEADIRGFNNLKDKLQAEIYKTS